ncbi:MAG TPA: hypothetical protein ENN29_12140 [Candidatus Hydrogenedentes bacterium]|nr:hypothetical protein [Candidatus Hydrogenedentota bacterium]
MARISQHQLPHDEYHGVVIVGAGLSGLSAARILLEHDMQPLVLERESHAGGRCMTAVHNGGAYDMGAQFFTVRRPEFQHWTDAWIGAGAVREWTRGFPDISGISERASHPRYCGVAGMSALPDALAKGAQIRLNTSVKRISEGRACWLIDVENGTRIKADIVLLTPPLPAALRLISDENTWRMGALLLPLTGVEYVPCIAAAVALDGPSGLSAPGAIRVDGAVVAWLTDNQIKGISPDAPAVTAHASRAFSERHRDTPLDVVEKLLAEALARFLKSPITSLSAYRWDYGIPANTLQKNFYLVEGRAPLYFAGDAFCGGQIEGATLSGIAAGKAITERLRLSKNTAGRPVGG